MSHDHALPAPWSEPALQQFRDEIKRLHGRFLGGDSAAGGEVCRRLFIHLTEHYRHARHEDGWADGVAEALRIYWCHPAVVDPECGPLDIYLYWIASRVYCNNCRSDCRRRKREQRDLENYAAFFLGKGCSAEYLYVEEEKRDKLRQLIACLKDPIERTFILMRLDGIEDDAEYVRVLVAANPCLAGASPEKLKHEVNKAQDRAMHKLRYWAEQLKD